MNYDTIFQPLTLRGLTLENRIVMPSMGTLMADADSYVTDKMIDYYAERAKNGVSLILMECSPVLPENTQGFAPGISDDRFIPGLTRLVKAVHEVGGKIGIQVYEPAEGVHNSHADTRHLRITGPVDRCKGRWKALPLEEFPRVAACFGLAARRAEKCGFDAIEIHCGHNYLLHQFLSPHFNQRTDGYGTTFENCMKFPLMCIEQVRKNFPQDKPMFMRIVAHDDYTRNTVGKFNGLTLDDMVEFCRKAGQLGVDVVDVSRGNFGRGNVFEVPAAGIPYAYNLKNAVYLKEHTRMHIMAVGRLGRPELASAALHEGVDLVGWGHAHLADPMIVNKVREGRLEDICYCIGCDQACSEAYHHPEAEHISCMRNPAVGREREFIVTPADPVKTVLIAGGGVGGLECGKRLAKRGHKVVLYEKSPNLGGRFKLAGSPPEKEDFAAAADWMMEQASKAGVKMHINQPVTPKLLAEVRPDHLVIAIGGYTKPLRVPGGENAVSCTDVLSNRKRAFGSCIVVGGGLTGVEVAQYVERMGMEVTILSRSPKIGKGLSHGRVITLGNYLETHPNIHVITSATVEKVEVNQVHVHILEKNTDRKTGQVTVVRNERRIYTADTIIAAPGSGSLDYSELSRAADQLGIPYSVIGDANSPRVAVSAIREAAEVALVI